MHIRIRKDVILRISVGILFTLVSVILILVLINQGKENPAPLERVLAFDSFVDFFVSSIGGILVGLLVAVVLIILIRISLFSQRFRGPTLVILEALQNLEHGNFDHRMRVSDDSEILPVAEDFNHMKDALEDRLHLVEQTRKELENIEFNLRKMKTDNTLGPAYFEHQLGLLRKKINMLRIAMAEISFSKGEPVPNILVIGGGGREHVLCTVASRSPAVEKVYAIPGNAGIEELAGTHQIPLEPPFRQIKDFCHDQSIDLVIIGPEQPLVDGLADELRDAGFPVFGPDRKGAKIEGSKAYAKALMKKYHIPTAAYEEFDDFEAACSYVNQSRPPFVIKADGLAAGKGVIICQDKKEAKEILRSYMLDRRFGAAGEKVVIEEYLSGEEASVLAFVDRHVIKPLVAAQDHKPVNDNDEGPNTGGMGAYAPAPVVTPELADQIEKEILRPMHRAILKEGMDYRGILYAGLMITDQGPKVIEFNCRFGDPEAQVVLPLLQTDFIHLAWATANNRLRSQRIEYKDKAAVCVVLASGGYPGSYEKGFPISGLDELGRNITIFHAGTARDADNHFVTAGGRVLGVTAVDSSLEHAIRSVYQAVDKIKFKGKHYRRDIGKKGLGRK